MVNLLPMQSTYYLLYAKYYFINNFKQDFIPVTDTVIFDNSYSYLRNKKVHYSISVAPPLEEPDNTPEE